MLALQINTFFKQSLSQHLNLTLLNFFLFAKWFLIASKGKFELPPCTSFPVFKVFLYIVAAVIVITITNIITHALQYVLNASTPVVTSYDRF